MTKLGNKGFFSVDALLALFLLLTVSLALVNTYQAREDVASWIGARGEAKMVGEELAGIINTVYANGSGFELCLNLSENVGGNSYRITFDNSTRQISVENSAWGAVNVRVIPKNVENFVLEPENLESTICVYWAADENIIKVVNR